MSENSSFKSIVSEFKGIVEKIVFKNTDNGYTVLVVKSKENSITAVGVMAQINVGESLEIRGYFKKHPSFGKQFFINSFKKFMPKTKDSIEKYLSSGVIKGIGSSRAKEIVKMFGDKSLDVIKNDPDRLSMIKGITKKTAIKMSKEFGENFELKELINYLSSFEVELQDVVKIFKKFGNESLKIIKENPYILCLDPFYIDFKKADKIFIGKNEDYCNLIRVKALITYLLSYNSKVKGHTCLPRKLLLKACDEFTNVPFELFDNTLDEMIKDSSVKSYSFDGLELIYLPEIFKCEEYICKRIFSVLKVPSKNSIKVDCFINKIERANKIKYAEKQKKAIKLALENKILILTGGPGTGKTTVLKAIIKILKENCEKVCLTAPTGRAAQKMSELTNTEAKTIHRLLEAERNEGNVQVFRKNEKNLLKYNTIIIDEFSMVDIFMFEGILKALPFFCRLIIVGDKNQLPSVGCGNILSDLVKSKKIPIVHLDEIFRQSLKSLIIKNAHRVIKGDDLLTNSTDSDFFFLNINDASSIERTIIDLYVNRLPTTYGYSSYTDIQVICPGKKGLLGANNLNKSLQDAANVSSGSKVEVKIGETIFREEDKVMQTKNNYDLESDSSNGVIRNGVFNGDIGFIIKIDKTSEVIDVRFYERIVHYSFEQAQELTLAYASTVHKSQGSEYKAVIMPIFPGPSQLYYRKLLYTGITRARLLLILIGRKEIASKMISNDKKTKRCSGLYAMLET
ncbi:MAG: ATP-dependent RecD-like DNA helicase [Oscillospiraceae bacterium]|jgi:exodeoxyribonuclease V alpha subunit|nr:ATP-dependent RecD-like DNA helicase [Oscillospiraceae bacterium]